MEHVFFFFFTCACIWWWVLLLTRCQLNEPTFQEWSSTVEGVPTHILVFDLEGHSCRLLSILLLDMGEFKTAIYLVGLHAGGRCVLSSLVCKIIRAEVEPCTFFYGGGYYSLTSAPSISLQVFLAYCSAEHINPENTWLVDDLPRLGGCSHGRGSHHEKWWVPVCTIISLFVQPKGVFLTTVWQEHMIAPQNSLSQMKLGFT